MVNQLKLAKQLNELYIEYVNDFLTIEAYARYKGFRKDFATAVINAGRKINHCAKTMRQIAIHDYYEGLYEEDILYVQVIWEKYESFYTQN
jgi:hypothetical protein